MFKITTLAKRYLAQMNGKRSASDQPASINLSLHTLESREVPAYLANGVLTIEGGPSADYDSVAQYGSIVVVYENNTTQLFSMSDIYNSSVLFRGNGGNDIFSCQADLRVVAYGGAGNDIIVGGAYYNTIYGGSGNDTIYGSYSDDTIYGREGPLDNNLLLGLATDNDVIYGMGGSDTIDGQVGNDTIIGGQGLDTLIGGRGNDRISGNDGGDIISGGDGDDWLIGCTDGNAAEDGGANDVIYGGTGNDTLWGGEGNDKLFGEAGNDWLNGEGGNDILFGGAFVDRDTLIGSGGADAFLSMNNEDYVADKTGEDGRINFGGDGNRFWSETEVKAIADGAAFLLNHVGNARLLRTSNNREIEVPRVEYLASEYVEGPSNAANFCNGLIMFSDLGVSRTASGVASTFIHEIGHNWDDESVFWGDWLKLSGWEPSDGSVPAGKKLSKDGHWIHSDSASFMNRNGTDDDYGRTNPYEDWSTSWQIYQRAHNKYPGHPHYDTEYANHPTKMAMIDAFFKWASR